MTATSEEVHRTDKEESASNEMPETPPAGIPGAVLGYDDGRLVDCVVAGRTRRRGCEELPRLRALFRDVSSVGSAHDSRK